MDIFTTFQIAGSALKAQRIRLNTISSNIANVETTSTPEGGPYRRKSVYFATKDIPFADHLDVSMNKAVKGVQVTEITEDTDKPRMIYNPSHPDANQEGYVAMPNISVLKEMVDMMSATRSYEANTATIKSAKRMALKALEIGR